MKMFRFSCSLSSILSGIFSLNSWARGEAERPFEDAVFDSDIKSVQLFSSGSELSMPVLSLGSRITSYNVCYTKLLRDPEITIKQTVRKVWIYC